MEGAMNTPSKKLKKVLIPRETPEGHSTSKKNKRIIQPPSPIKEAPSSGKKMKRKFSENDDTILNASDLSENVSHKANSVKKRKKSDHSFEKAVQKARGMPDGESIFDRKKKEKTNSAASQKPGKFEKNIKPKNMNMKNGTKKFNKFAGKDDKKKFGQKKSSDQNSESKKVKAEELSVKERRKQRKMMKNNYDLCQSLKQHWEALRKHKLNKAKKKEICDKVFAQISGKATELIKAHDTARVVQSLIKYGSEEHRDAVFQELKDSILEMTKSKYARYIVMKILKYGNASQRKNVFASFHGQVRKLIRHEHAADVLEFAYNNFANAAQRSAIVEEFYGPSFALFKTGEIRTLEQIMKSHPDKRDSIISNLKSSLSILAEKNVIRHSIVHRLYLEFFTYAPPTPRTEMIETLRESLIHMLHTRDGSRVAMYCLWYGSSKDRKVIVKSMKTYVQKICQEEYGHLVMLAMFDVVDDTKLVHKAILEEMMKSVKEMAFDQFGRKVLLYLLAPRASVHFHPDIVQILQQGDGNPNSKKDVEIRRRELLEAVSKPLLQFVVDSTSELMTNNSALLLLLEILAKATDDPTNAMTAVAEGAASAYEEGGEPHIIDDTAGHMTLKRLIANDSERIKQGKTVLFSTQLKISLAEGALRSWAACNRGCFIICGLLDLDNAEVNQWAREEVLPITDSLKKMTFKGAQILLGKLAQ